MRNSQKVRSGDVLIGNNTDISYYVDNVSENGNMTITNLESKEKERVSVTFANSCLVYREIE